MCFPGPVQCLWHDLHIFHKDITPVHCTAALPVQRLVLYMSLRHTPPLEPTEAVRVQLFMQRQVLRRLVNQCYIVG